MGVSKVIINGVTKIDITSDTVAANKLLSGYTAHGADGNAVSGSIATKTSSDMTVSGRTVTVPAGYYASEQSKSIAFGTEGTPTATKGTVSNHSVSVTPSVTNVSGYIVGGTHTGTAVTVSASELVSGTKSISSNGSDIDVTNYASVDVDVQPSLEAVTDVDPIESSQTITAGSSYDGLSSVQINAIPSDYVGSDIPQNDSSDLTASGATVTAPAGYYASDATKTISSGSATTPSTSITANPTISVNSTTGVISSSVSGSKSVTPTVSAGYVSSGTAGTVSVSGSNTSQLSTQAGTTISPTESEQTAVAAGKYTLGAVKVGAISSTYVGSDIPQNDSDDLTASGATVTAPAGYYAEDATKTIASGSATTPATSITASPTISVNSTTGLITATVSGSKSVTPTISAGYISSGTAGTVSVTGSNTSQLSTKAAATITPGTTDQTIAAGQYLLGVQTILGDSDLIAANIADDTTIFGVTGTLERATALTAQQILTAVQAGWV